MADIYQDSIVAPALVMQAEASSHADQGPLSRAIPLENTRIFDDAMIRDLCARWDQVQSTFIDDPRHAVELANAMIGLVVKSIADRFAEEHARLELQLSLDKDVSTEELRQNFKHYRRLFDRLLTL